MTFRLRGKMPAFCSTYSDLQREVLFRETIDHARTVKEVLRAARALELDGLERAESAHLGAMAYAYACQLVRAERQERDGIAGARAQPVPIARDIAVRLLKRAQRDAEKITKATGKPMDTGHSQQLLKVASSAAQLLRELDAPTKTAGKATTATSAPATKPATLAATIAAGTDSAADDAAQDHSASGEREAPHNNETNDSTDKGSDGPVRLRAVAGRGVGAGEAVV